MYAPQIVDLNCDGSSALPNGSWYHYSYGTIATYKQDWESFGGFSHDFMHKITWGGEDWDIIDSAVKGGLEIERKRSPWVYHYFHSKKGMWQKANTTVAVTSRKIPKMRTPEKIPLAKINAPPPKGILRRKEAALRKETPLQKEAPVRKVAPPLKKIPLQAEVSINKEAPSKIEVPPQREVAIEKRPLHQKEGRHRKEHRTRKAEAPPGREVSPKQGPLSQKRRPPGNEPLS